MDEKTIEERVESGVKNNSSLNKNTLKSIIIMLDPEKEKGGVNMMAHGASIKTIFGLTQRETGEYMMAYLRG